MGPEEFRQFMEQFEKDAADSQKDMGHIVPGTSSLDEFLKVYAANYRYSEVTSSIQAYFTGLDLKTLTENATLFGGEEAAKNVKNSYMNYLVYADYDPLDKIRNNEKLSEAEKISQMEKHIQEKNLTAKFEKRYKLYVAGQILNTLKTKEGIEAFFEKAKENNIDIDAIIPQEKITVPNEPGFKEDAKFKEKEINAIIASLDPVKDKETIDALNHSNSILTKAENTGYTMHLSEDYGKYSDRTANAGFYKYMDEHFKDNKEYNNHDIGAVDCDATKDGFLKDYKELQSTELTRDPAAKNKILDLIQKMDEYGMIPQSANAEEQGVKIYAFSALANKKKEILTAVNNKDLTNLSKLNKEYDGLMSKYDQLLEEVKELGDKTSIVGNISVSRNENIPMKYRNDFVGASRLAGLYIMATYCRKNGIDIGKFIDDPSNAVMEKAKETYENNSASRYLKSHSVEDLMVAFTTTGNEFDKAYFKEDYSLVDYTRPFESVACLLSPEERPTLDAKAQMTQNLLKNNSFYQTGPGRHLDDISTLCTSTIILDPKDRNYYRMTNYAKNIINPLTMEREKELNLEEYVAQGKTTYEAVRGRLLEASAAISKTNQIFQDKVTSAVKITAHNVLKADTKMPSAERKVFEIMTKANPSAAEKLVMDTKIQTHMSSMQKNPTVENTKTAIKGLAEIQTKYNNKFFLARWFGAEGRLLRSSMNMLMEDFRKMGIPETDLQASLKGFKEGKSETVKAEENPAPQKVEEVTKQTEKVALAIDLDTGSVTNQKTNEVMEKGTSAEVKKEELAGFEKENKDKSLEKDDIQMGM